MFKVYNRYNRCSGYKYATLLRVHLLRASIIGIRLYCFIRDIVFDDQSRVFVRFEPRSRIVSRNPENCERTSAAVIAGRFRFRSRFSYNSCDDLLFLSDHVTFHTVMFACGRVSVLQTTSLWSLDVHNINCTIVDTVHIYRRTGTFAIEG